MAWLACVCGGGGGGGGVEEEVRGKSRLYVAANGIYDLAAQSLGIQNLETFFFNG